MANNQESKGGVQGEGDYESARRYNEHTSEHVKRMTPEELQTESSRQSPEQAAQARAVGESRSKAGGQDHRDAEVFRALEKDRKS